MALRGMDFSNSNRAIARFNQFLQYDLLDQMKSDRDVDILKVSDRLQRERQIEAGEIDVGVARYKSALTDKEAYTKAMLDISKLPEADYLQAMARLATNPNLPPEYHGAARNAAQKYANMVRPLALAAYNASRGITTWDDYESILSGMGSKGLMDMTQETGMNIRAQGVAKTEGEKLGVEREKVRAGIGKTGKSPEEVRAERYLKLIDDTIGHLQAEGVQGEALVGNMPIYLESKTRDPLSSENRGKALTYLNQLKVKVIDGSPLTDANTSFITRVWNTPGVQGFVSGRLSGAAEKKPTGAGLPNPETGVSEGDEAIAAQEKKAALIRHYADIYIQQVLGGTRTPENEAKATADATEFVEKYIYKK